MRIGVSTSVIQRGKSGVGQYVLALLRAMASSGDSSKPPDEIFVFALEDDLPLFDFAGERVRLVPVPEKFRAPVKNIFWHQARLPRLAREWQLDVLHVPSYRRMLWPKPCPLVSTIHDLAPFSVPGKYDPARMFYGRVVARRLARRQDRIIAVSRRTAADIEKFFGLSGPRVSVIYNGLDHSRFFSRSQPHAKMAAAGRHGLTKPFFLYVARLEHPAKNHVRLISAFDRFKSATHSDWQLVFGGQDWHGAEMIHAAADRSPFAPDIRFPGFVPDQDLPGLYRAADAFVYPSLYEGFGMPPIEAMACGCPVICSTSGSLGEVVGEAAAVVDAHSPDSIAKQLSALARDPELRGRLRAAGLERAGRFDWRRTAGDTLKVFYHAAARRNGLGGRNAFAPGSVLHRNATDG